MSTLKSPEKVAQAVIGLWTFDDVTDYKFCSRPIADAIQAAVLAERERCAARIIELTRMRPGGASVTSERERRNRQELGKALADEIRKDDKPE